MATALRNTKTFLSAKARRALGSTAVQRFIADRRGAVAVIGAMVIPVALGMGAVVSVSYSIGHARSNFQNALDSAVLAGAVDTRGADSQVATAKKYFSVNLSNYTSVATTSVSTSFSVNAAGVLNGTATGAVKNPWGGFLGLPQTIPVSAKAAATGSRGSLCVLGLSAFDSGAFDINGNAVFNAPNCAVMMNSNSSDGISMEGNSALATAKAFGVAGGHTGVNFTPTPIHGAAKVEDPYKSVAFPSMDSCSSGFDATEITDDTTLSPGTYCGGVRIKNKAHVTLSPGVYVMNGGPFHLTGQSSATGDQVMIAFTGDDSTLYLSGGSTMTVTSPTSGTYANFQFFQDRTQPIPKLGTGAEGLWFSVGGNSGDGSRLSYDGIAYLPTQNVWIYGSAVVAANSPTMALVTGKLWVQGNAALNITNENPRGVTGAPGPHLISSAKLVQ